MYTLKPWHAKTLSEHQQLRDAAKNDGYVFLTLSLYGTKASPLYAAVMIKQAGRPAQRDFAAQSLHDFKATIADQETHGWSPVMICATGSAADPLFAGVFEKFDDPKTAPVVALQLVNGDDGNDQTIQGMNKKARDKNLKLRWAASYGDTFVPLFAGIWVPNSGDDIVLWNADGVLDNGDDYQARFDAQTASWSRPEFVTLNSDRKRLSVFVGNEVGGWHARHGLDSDGYHAEYETWVVGKKYLPVVVQAGGDDEKSAGFDVIFIQQQKPTPLKWTAAGTTGNATIDGIFKKAMRESPVRHAALAIVHKKRLVYARGYTLAEPDWPVVQPTDCFRLASCSKMITALAIYQLIHQGKLKLTDTAQSILGLKTPAGNPPTDLLFNLITVQHLLEHTSGLQPTQFENLAALRAAFLGAGQIVELPVSSAATDSFIATLTLNNPPGITQTYNNCGYYLLGRIAKAKWDEARPIDAYQKHLLDPLHIKRIRRAKDLIADQPKDEARYQHPRLSVGPSVFSPLQPLVATDYGTAHFEILDGDGGLTAAVTDVARLIAILVSKDDNPAMPRHAISAMLQHASTVSAAGGGRAGYGFDGAADLGGDSFYAQKGGSISDAHSVVQFNGDWGYVACWAGEPTVAHDWYPDYNNVMDVAKTAFVSAADHFPHYGMPSL
ncbi:MAG: serine hydrolase [bacterium]